MSGASETPDAVFVARLLKLVLFGSIGVGCYLAFVPTLPNMSVFRLSDILLHMSGFVYLTFVLALAYPQTPPLRVAVWLISYGAFVEVVQYFVPKRDAELKDLLMDAVGIAVGLLVARLGAGPLRRLLFGVVGRVWPA